MIQYEMQLRQAGAIINEQGDVVTPPLTKNSFSNQPQAGGQRILVPAPKSISATSPSHSSRSSGTIAEALRDASRAPATKSRNGNDGRLITDQGKTRYIEK